MHRGSRPSTRRCRGRNRRVRPRITVVALTAALHVREVGVHPDTLQGVARPVGQTTLPLGAPGIPVASMDPELGEEGSAR